MVIVVVEIEVVVIEVAVTDVVVCVVSVPDVVVDVPLAPIADDGGCMADAKLAAKARRSRCGCRGTLVIAHPSTNQSVQNGQSMTKSKCSCSKVRQPLESFGNLQSNKGGQFPLPKTFQTHFRTHFRARCATSISSISRF